MSTAGTLNVLAVVGLLVLVLVVIFMIGGQR